MSKSTLMMISLTQLTRHKAGVNMKKGIFQKSLDFIPTISFKFSKNLFIPVQHKKE